MKNIILSTSVLLALVLSLFACAKDGAPGGAATSAATSEAATEAVAEKIDDSPALDLTESLWEFPGETRRVYKFFDDGKMIEYGAFTDVCAVSADMAHEEMEYRWENGSLVIECRTGIMAGSVKRLTLCDSLPEAFGSEGAPEALAGLADGEQFFFEPDAANEPFYMIRSDCVDGDGLDAEWKREFISDLLEAVEEDNIDDFGGEYSVLRDGSYYLYDVEQDGVPELFYTSDIHAHATTMRVFMWRGVVRYYLGRTIRFSDEPNIFEDSDGNSGWFGSTVNKLEHGYLTELHHSEFGVRFGGDLEEEYYWDGERMSQEEYDAFEKQFIYFKDGEYRIYDHSGDLNWILKEIADY